MSVPGGALLQFRASDVTGTHSIEASGVQPALPAGAVAQAIANRMSLPASVPWALRNDATSVYLDPAIAIGDQLEPDAEVTITPKTHLG